MYFPTDVILHVFAAGLDGRAKDDENDLFTSSIGPRIRSRFLEISTRGASTRNHRCVGGDRAWLCDSNDSSSYDRPLNHLFAKVSTSTGCTRHLRLPDRLADALAADAGDYRQPASHFVDKDAGRLGALLGG